MFSFFWKWCGTHSILQKICLYISIFLKRGFSCVLKTLTQALFFWNNTVLRYIWWCEELKRQTNNTVTINQCVLTTIIRPQYSIKGLTRRKLQRRWWRSSNSNSSNRRGKRLCRVICILLVLVSQRKRRRRKRRKNQINDIKLMWEEVGDGVRPAKRRC